MTAIRAKGLSGRTVLLCLLGFFAVVIGMNILMASFAVKTFDGQIEEDAYRNGLKFNDRIENARAQESAGWSASVAYAVDDHTVTVQLLDALGKALKGAQLEALLWRQTVGGMDVPLSFQERVDGQYVASIPRSIQGRYELRLTATHTQTRVTFKRSLQLPPQDQKR